MTTTTTTTPTTTLDAYFIAARYGMDAGLALTTLAADLGDEIVAIRFRPFLCERGRALAEQFGYPVTVEWTDGRRAFGSVEFGEASQLRPRGRVDVRIGHVTRNGDRDERGWLAAVGRAYANGVERGPVDRDSLGWLGGAA